MSDGFAPAELMAVVMAREFRNDEVVVMGAVPALPLAACRLARKMHAPDLSYIVGGSGTVNSAPEVLPDSSCDPALAAAPATLPLPEIVLLEGRGDAFDVFCAGGLQIDAYGNCNLIAIGDWSRPALRGPGSVGLPFLANTRRSVIYTMAHGPRTLVEKVDHVSGPGHRPGSGSSDDVWEGPSLVVTPLATLDFDPDTGRMRLATVHPGVTEAEARAATGFDLAGGPEVLETPAPTQDELTKLRRIDPTGVLRN
jgi:glutaconate CoA-transferase subunit B